MILQFCILWHRVNIIKLPANVYKQLGLEKNFEKINNINGFSRLKCRNQLLKKKRYSHLYQSKSYYRNGNIIIVYEILNVRERKIRYF